MTATWKDDVLISEQDRVEYWRAAELERAGYPETVAIELAHLAYVDLHRAVALLANGCDVDTAADILR